MVKPTQGVSGGPLLLAVAALLAASASIGLAAGASRAPDKHPSTNAAVRAPAEQDAKRRPPTRAKHERVAGPATELAPAGDPSGDDVGSSIALCHSGMRVVSGGYRTLTGGGETFYSDALTDGRVGWAVGAVNDLATTGTVQAVAYCVRSGQAVAAGTGPRLARQRAAARREMKTLVDKYRALRSAQL